MKASEVYTCVLSRKIELQPHGAVSLRKIYHLDDQKWHKKFTTKYITLIDVTIFNQNLSCHQKVTCMHLAANFLDFGYPLWRDFNCEKRYITFFVRIS